jgi:hypothetical protein
VSYNPLLSSLIEIFDGYSRFDLNGRTLFFRHFCLKDQNSISLSFERYKNIAIKKGIETQDEIHKRLKEEKCWTDNEDIKISELESYIANLKKTKGKLLLPSQRDSHQILIDEEELKLNNLIATKKELTGISAEEYANKMANEEFLRLLLYKDKSLKELAFCDEDFGALNTQEIVKISENYFKISETLNDENIQKIVLQDFFNMYLSSCENSYNFFGKFIYQMSTYQIKLLLYGRVFHNIFQYNEEIPENLRKDPKAIFGYVDSKKSREKYQNEVKDSDGSILFGATEKDVNILDPSAKKISLSEELAKSGGSLSMEQMMELMGN